MKKIINGKMYDTGKSELIYTELEGKRWMYRTSKGAFYKVYSTGDFVPMSDEQAMEYIGEKDPDKYIELFGNPEEA